MGKCRFANALCLCDPLVTICWMHYWSYNCKFLHCFNKSVIYTTPWRFLFLFHVRAEYHVFIEWHSLHEDLWFYWSAVTSILRWAVIAHSCGLSGLSTWMHCCLNITGSQHCTKNCMSILVSIIPTLDSGITTHCGHSQIFYFFIYIFAFLYFCVHCLHWIFTIFIFMCIHFLYHYLPEWWTFGRYSLFDFMIWLDVCYYYSIYYVLCYTQ